MDTGHFKNSENKAGTNFARWLCQHEQSLLQLGPSSVCVDILYSFRRDLYVDRQFLLVIGLLG